MKRVTSIATACIAAVLLAWSVSVGAQDFNTFEKTFLTFNNAVELPGMTLPAGTYTFKLADTPARNIVQVLSQDEKEVHGQFLFVQAERPEVTGETVITFREEPEGATPAVQYWYYPGEKIGKEFIYSTDQAMAISARAGGAEVMTEEGPVSANSTASSTNTQDQVTESNREQATTAPADADVAGTASASADQPETQTAQATTPAPAETAPVERNTPPASADAADDSRAVGTSGVQDAQPEARATELPATASPLALSGLLGLLSLAGAFGLRMFRG